MGVGVYRVVTAVVLLTALCRGVPVGLPLPRRGGTHHGNAYHRYDHRPQRDQPRVVDSDPTRLQPQSQIGPVALPLHPPQLDNVFPVQPQGDIVVPVRSIATNYNNITTNRQTKLGSNNKAVKFMQQFGYIPKPVDGAADFVMTKDYFRNQIKKVQKFGDIPQTGELDESTLELLETPRCGLPDLEPEEIEGNHRRRKRYILGSEGWKKRNLTYYLANWSGKLRSKEAVQVELRRAFDAWSVYSHLRFREVNETEYSEADIVIFFAEYSHHDGYPFDGPSGILAHAYYPYEFGHYGGDVHFDESEEWTMHPKDEYSGLDFFTVAVHELGHSLGLSHSPVGGSIMFPYYKGYDPNFALDYDDVMAMWDLYIKRKLEGDDEFVHYPTTTTTTTVTPPKEDDESHQADASDDDGNNDENHHDHNNDNDNNNDDSDNENDNNIDNDYANDDDQVRYHGDYETVDEHKRRVGKDRGIGPDLPNLPTLPSDSDSHSAEGEGGGKRRTEDDDFYEEDRKRKEEVGKKREEERRRQADEDAERKRWEEEIRRQEEEIRRREKEERRKWEEEERQRDEAWEGSQGNGGKEKLGDKADKKPKAKPKKPPPIPDICDGNIDAIGVIRQELFIFKGQYLWRYTERNQLRPGYPSLIRNMFKSLPSYLQKVDAVYEKRATGQIVFFIGKYYYIHDGDRLMEGFPKPITDFGLPQVLTELDSVFFWPRADKLYFFNRNLYWRYNETAKIMDKRYPRDMRNWNGLPTDIQAAFTYTDGNSYFFKGKDYWRYNNQDIAPDNGYPRDVTMDWCGC